jgi:hypothetical protein
MFNLPFLSRQFLRSVYGTQSFVEYCKKRGISFEQKACGKLGWRDLRRWTAAMAKLSADSRAQIEFELAMANELAGRDANEHLIEAAAREDLPPDSVPAGAPLVLWFLLRRPEVFREVFLHYESREVDAWRSGRAPPNLQLPNTKAAAAALGEVVLRFFGVRKGATRLIAAEVHQFPDALCFVARIAGRLRFVESVTKGGRSIRKGLRSTRLVVFAYYPDNGMILFKSDLRSRERATKLFHLLGKAALGVPVSCDTHAFDLELLKWPFHPLPDAADVEMVRVKSLHLRYPARAGRRQLKLETLESDEPAAMDALLRAHVGDKALTQLRVSHAELQVRLRERLGRKNHTIQLWPDRSSLGQTPLSDRLRACLKRWGITRV